jgi:hypothetical protein
VSPADEVAKAVKGIASAKTWNKRVALIRGVPEEFGKAQHQAVYAAIAEAIYVSQLAPDFAYIHWRDEYELPKIEHAYGRAFALTHGFVDVGVDALARIIEEEPTTLRVFRLLLGFTTQEFAASTIITAGQLEKGGPLSNGAVKTMENGKAGTATAAKVAAAVIDQTMRGNLFAKRTGEVRSKISKPDTVAGWDTVRKYAVDNVPFPIFLHQRHYGGAFRQLLDATSGKRGDLLEQIVEELFIAKGVRFVRTGPSNQKTIATKFGLTVKPAPDFVVHDAAGSMKAILECKQANDGGTARDKASRFASLRNEAMRPWGRSSICRARWISLAADRGHARSRNPRYRWQGVYGSNVGFNDDCRTFSKSEGLVENGVLCKLTLSAAKAALGNTVLRLFSKISLRFDRGYAS